ncbi:MAG: hypothetical protein JW838_13995 [Spirochaetes bacterium]|nr:hypothetical protein [Spirochaetota bacterium]
MRYSILAAAVAFFFAIAASGCKQAGKYDELKEYMHDVITANEEYVTSLEKAQSAREVADAITALGNRMGALNKRSREIEKKYPELKSDAMKKEPPKELREEFARMEKMAQRLLAASMKMMKYIDDPAVIKASREMESKLRRPPQAE